MGQASLKGMAKGDSTGRHQHSGPAPSRQAIAARGRAGSKAAAAEPGDPGEWGGEGVTQPMGSGASNAASATHSRASSASCCWPHHAALCSQFNQSVFACIFRTTFIEPFCKLNSDILGHSRVTDNCVLPFKSPP
jgi:hypothetical protein